MQRQAREASGQEPAHLLLRKGSQRWQASQLRPLGAWGGPVVQLGTEGRWDRPSIGPAARSAGRQRRRYHHILGWTPIGVGGGEGTLPPARPSHLCLGTAAWDPSGKDLVAGPRALRRELWPSGGAWSGAVRARGGAPALGNSRGPSPSQAEGEERRCCWNWQEGP